MQAGCPCRLPYCSCRPRHCLLSTARIRPPPAPLPLPPLFPPSASRPAIGRPSLLPPTDRPPLLPQATRSSPTTLLSTQHRRSPLLLRSTGTLPPLFLRAGRCPISPADLRVRLHPCYVREQCPVLPARQQAHSQSRSTIKKTTAVTRLMNHDSQPIWNKLHQCIILCKPLHSAKVKQNFHCSRGACRCGLYNAEMSRNKKLNAFNSPLKEEKCPCMLW